MWKSIPMLGTSGESLYYGQQLTQWSNSPSSLLNHLTKSKMKLFPVILTCKCDKAWHLKIPYCAPQCSLGDARWRVGTMTNTTSESILCMCWIFIELFVIAVMGKWWLDCDRNDTCYYCTKCAIISQGYDEHLGGAGETSIVCPLYPLASVSLYT